MVIDEDGICRAYDVFSDICNIDDPLIITREAAAQYIQYADRYYELWYDGKPLF